MKEMPKFLWFEEFKKGKNPKYRWLDYKEFRKLKKESPTQISITIRYDSPKVLVIWDKWSMKHSYLRDYKDYQVFKRDHNWKGFGKVIPYEDFVVEEI